MSINSEWINKLWYVHSVEYYSAKTKTKPIDVLNNIDEAQNN